MVKTIETKAVISAADQTGNTFAQVANKLKQMEEVAKRVDKNVGKVAKTAATTPRGIATSMKTMSGMGLNALGVASMVRNAVGAVAAGAAVHHIVAAGAKQMHEKVRMEAAGMSSKEIQEATTEAAKLSSKFASIGQTDMLHMLRNARSIVGSYKEAAEIAEPLAKLRVIAQANRPGGDVSEDFDQLVKGLEIKGVTQDPKQFHQYMEGIAKGLNVFGDTLKPYQYYEMFKYGRQATAGLSEHFILGTAPTLAQELGGSSYGNAVAGFNRAVVGGRMEHSAIKEMVRLGLLGKDDVDWLKNGQAKAIKPGHHVRGWELAQEDPNEWVKQRLLPSYDKMGFNEAERRAEASVLFSNKVAAQMIQILSTQQSRINKDLALLAHAPGLSAAEKYQNKDPTIIAHAFGVQVENMAARWGTTFARAGAPILLDVTKKLSEYNRHLAEDVDSRINHPGEATPSQKRFNRLMNRVMAGVDSDKSFTEAETLRKVHEKELDDRRRNLWLGHDDMRAARGALSHEGPRPGPDGWFGHERADWDLQHGLNTSRMEGGRGRIRTLNEMNWATLQKMLTERALDRVNSQIRIARGGGAFAAAATGMGDSVMGRGAFPMPGTGWRGYGGVNPMAHTIGAPERPVVKLPEGMQGSKEQKVDVGVHATADPIKVEATFKVEPGSALLAIVEQTKTATAQANLVLHTSGAGQAPGSKGTTDFGLPQQKP